MTNIDDLQEEKKEINDNLTDDENKNKYPFWKKKLNIKTVLLTISISSTVLACGISYYYLGEIDKWEKELSDKEQQILQTPGLSMAERKIKLLNDLYYYNLTPDYKNRVIQEVLDLGYNVIVKRIIVDGKEKTVYDIVKR